MIAESPEDTHLCCVCTHLVPHTLAEFQVRQESFAIQRKVFSNYVREGWASLWRKELISLIPSWPDFLDGGNTSVIHL